MENHRRGVLESKNRIVASAQCGNVNGSIKKSRLHLATQGVVDVLDFNTALDEAFRSLKGQPILLVFCDREVQRPFDGFGFCAQRFLCALDLCRIQLEMLVGSPGGLTHGKAALSRHYSIYVQNIILYVHEYWQSTMRGSRSAVRIPSPSQLP